MVKFSKNCHLATMWVTVSRHIKMETGNLRGFCSSQNENFMVACTRVKADRNAKNCSDSECFEHEHVLNRALVDVEY